MSQVFMIQDGSGMVQNDFGFLQFKADFTVWPWVVCSLLMVVCILLIMVYSVPILL